MKKISFAMAFTFQFIIGYAQNDTTILINQKGILFLSDYNFLYDNDLGNEMRPIGFHDFFFPIKNFDSAWLTNENLNIAFKNGVRVDSMKSRNTLKKEAYRYNGKDTSSCYEYDKFYILPVIISYKIYSDNWPFICRRNFFNIQINYGSQLQFEYNHNAILPFNIIPILKPNSKHRTSTQNK